MAFKDYSTVASQNTSLTGGTYIGPSMLRVDVRPALQQIAADGKGLYNEMLAKVAAIPASPDFNQPGSDFTRSAKEKLADVASLKDFGVCGAGGDDTAVLTAAFNALNSGAIADLYIPAGVYKHSTPLPQLTRDGITIRGAGKRRTLLKPSAAVNCMHVGAADPVTNRLYDIGLTGFGIDYGDVTGPTAGLALRLSRVFNLECDVGIYNCYQGLLVEGGGGHDYRTSTIYASGTWGSLAANSFLARFTVYPGTTELPSEVMFGPVKWKGSTTSGNNYLDRALVVEACDGIAFTTGHIGFAHTAVLDVAAQSNASYSIIDLDMGRVYLDGNLAGSPTGAIARLSGSSLPTVGGIKLSSCKLRNFQGQAVKSSLSQLLDLDLDGIQCSDIGKEFLEIDGAADLNLNGSTFRRGNLSGTAVSAIKLANVDNLTAQGVQVHPGVNAYLNDFELTAVLTGSLVGNLTSAATDYKVNPGCDRLRWAANSRATDAPSVAAADGLALPMGFPELVVLTGNANMSNISALNFRGYTQTFGFTGTASVNDNAGNIQLAGSFTATAGSTLTLRNDGTKWVEVSRSIV